MLAVYRHFHIPLIKMLFFCPFLFHDEGFFTSEVCFFSVLTLEFPCLTLELWTLLAAGKNNLRKIKKMFPLPLHQAENQTLGYIIKMVQIKDELRTSQSMQLTLLPSVETGLSTL